MYILNVEDFDNFDLENALQFVEFWKQFYSDHNRTDDYIRNLNIGYDLTENNVEWLIDWKLPQPRNQNAIRKVVEETATLNQFRNGILGENEFRGIVAQIYRTGYVMSVFLFHICCPQQYPIWDRFVLKTFYSHAQNNVPNNANIQTVWNSYGQYRQYITQIYQACYQEFPDNNIELYVRNLKNIDNALWAFGKFLSKYGGN